MQDETMHKLYADAQAEVSRSDGTILSQFDTRTQTESEKAVHA